MSVPMNLKLGWKRLHATIDWVSYSPTHSGAFSNPPSEVLCVLVCMIFSMNTLPISPANELQHLELFAGDCAASRAEHMDTGLLSTWLMLYRKISYPKIHHV